MATVAGSTSSTNPPVPAFLLKLWLLVDDETTNNLIHWSTEGNSFVVVDQGLFAKDVLPRYFKHNNMTSFVRQLNMYGFRKKTHPEAGGLIQQETDKIEFQHPHFIRGQQEKLEQIKRKVSTKDDVKYILTDVKDIKTKQETITDTLDNMKKENESLWREMVFLRKKHDHQQKIISRLIQFLMTMAQPKKGVKRKQFPMIEGLHDASSSPKYTKRASIAPEDLFSLNKDDFGNSDNSSEQNPGLTLSEIIDPEIAEQLYTVTSSTEDSTVSPHNQEYPQSNSDLLFVSSSNPQGSKSDDAVLEALTLPIITSPGGTEEDGSEEDSMIPDTLQLVVPNVTVPDVRQTQRSTNVISDSGLQLLPRNQASSGSRQIMRQNSLEDHRQELGQHMDRIQSNLDFIQSLISSNPDMGHSDLLERIFLQSEGPVNYSQDFLTSLANSNGTSSMTSGTGGQLVQYNPTTSIYQGPSLPSSVLTADEEDSLLDSLKEDQAALERTSNFADSSLFSDISLSTPVLPEDHELEQEAISNSALEDAVDLL